MKGEMAAIRGATVTDTGPMTVWQGCAGDWWGCVTGGYEFKGSL